MTLPFKKEYKGLPTFFPHKILMSYLEAEIISKDEFDLLMAELLVHCPQCISDLIIKPKYHTIRTDAKDQWKADSDIHMVIGNRTKERYQFAPVTKVKRIDEVRITFDTGFDVQVNGNEWMDADEIERFAANDGFESVEDMAEWFFPNEKVLEVTGKIIHWTELVEY